MAPDGRERISVARHVLENTAAIDEHLSHMDMDLASG